MIYIITLIIYLGSIQAINIWEKHMKDPFLFVSPFDKYTPIMNSIIAFVLWTDFNPKI